MNRSPILTALFHPINLIMFLLIVTSGLCAAWWLAPIGLAIWLIMVVVIARDPGLKLSFTRQNRQPLSPRFQNRFDRLDRARFSIFNALQRSDSQVRKTVEPLIRAIDELVEHAYRLSLQMTVMDNNYSVQKITSTNMEDIAQMKKNITDITDDASKKEYEATLKSLQKRQAQLMKLGTVLSRFEAQLTGTTNTVDSVVTDIIGMQGRSSANTQNKITILLSTINSEQIELNQFDNELENPTTL